MEEIEDKKSIVKNEPRVKKGGSWVTVLLFGLSGIQFILIIMLFTKIDEHNHWNYAKESHSHYSSDVADHNHDYADSYHDHNYADSYHTHEEDSHEHSAKEINYNSWDYGGYGTLQAKIKEIENKLSEIDNKAEQNHMHNAYEIIGVANSTHTHSSYDIY